MIIQIAGLKNFTPPPTYDRNISTELILITDMRTNSKINHLFVNADIRLPERPKLNFMDKVPTYAANLKPPKSAKRLILMRGTEPIHNQFIHQQYGVVVKNIATSCLYKLTE